MREKVVRAGDSPARKRAAAAAALRRAGGPARPIVPDRARGAAGEAYPLLVAATRAAVDEHLREVDPIERTRLLGRLMDALLDELSWVTADRDQALRDVLDMPDRPSARALGARLGLANQRVGQLIRQVEAGGRPRRPDRSARADG